MELFGDEIERLSRIDTVTGEVDARLLYAPIYPATHYATNDEKRTRALEEIKRELAERIEFLKSRGR